jgi:hypothetical protein
VIEDPVYRKDEHDGCPLISISCGAPASFHGCYVGRILNHNTHKRTHTYTPTYRETMKEKSVMIDSFRLLSKVTCLCVCVCVSIAKKESDGKRAKTAIKFQSQR